MRREGEGARGGLFKGRAQRKDSREPSEHWQETGVGGVRWVQWAGAAAALSVRAGTIGRCRAAGGNGPHVGGVQGREHAGAL